MNKFRTQILGTLSLLIALTVFLLIGLSYSAFRQESITLNTEILQAKNDTVKNEINRQIDVYHGMLAGLNVTRADLQNGKLAAQAYSQLELLFNQFGKVANGTFLFSKDGDIWGRNGDPLDINVKAASRDYYQGVFQQNQSFYMSAPYVSSTSGKKVVGMAYRLNNDLAVLATINLDALLGSIYHRDDMFFFTSDGTILFSPYPELLDKNIFQLRPHYKNFSLAKPHISYQADVDGQAVAFTAFWSNIDANNWQFVTFFRNKSINQNANAQLISSILIAGISLLIVTGILWLVIQRLILTPVGGAPAEIASPMEKMAQGDLAQNLTKTGKETGIYASLINLSEQLSKLIKGSLGISESVSAASLELSTVMGETLRNAQDELEQVELISTALNELASTSMEVSDKASMAETETKRAQENVANGKKTLDQNRQLTAEIDSSIADSAKIVEQLQQYSVEIGSVTEVINNISEQTNLLALNAAIEAARAGEHGRGFAVVADEVRSLASKTQASTISIQENIEKLQSQSTKANQNMLRNVELIQESVKLADSVDASFEDISAAVESISELNSMVATAAQEQHSVIEDVSKNTTHAYDLVQQNVAAANQTMQAANELSQLAETQKSELEYFRV